MAVIKTKTHRVHDDACAAAEGVRQSVVVRGASQATVRSAEQAFYRAAISSAKINGLPHEPFIHALRDLGISDP